MSIGSFWGVSRSLVIYYGQPWKTARMRRFYRQFMGPGDLCFDVGAHVGNRVRAWSALGAEVVAIEPQPQMLSVLERLYGKKSNIQILPIGVADQSGSLELLINTRNPTLTTFSADWADQFSSNPDISAAPFDDVVTVPVETLDELIRRHGVPVFCKIDVEGFEDRVLGGLSTAIPALSFEAFPLQVERSVACVKTLMKLGDYRFRTVLAEEFRWVEDDWIDGDAMLARLSEWSLDEGSGDIYAQLHSM